MKSDQLEKVAANENNPEWFRLIKRENKIYHREGDIRSEFARDHTRVLHSLAYRRLKHKTQVFFNVGNDHICTRMEHTSHVESVSGTIAGYLGLNSELTRAISISHDIGHAPFGHQGEEVLKNLSRQYLQEDFWHEKNGLRFADKVELLEDNQNNYQNLNLTYAVRDGIISHCGEVDENGIRPRSEFLNLNEIVSIGQYQPVTWEGCVVKIADRIAYLGRDIEDAIRLNFLTKEKREILHDMVKLKDEKTINTTVIMHNMITDICKNSSVEKGICLSEEMSLQLDCIKEYNGQYIYGNKKLNPFKKYADLVINELFQALWDAYDEENTLQEVIVRTKMYPELMGAFAKWLVRYGEFKIKNTVLAGEIEKFCYNEKIYGNLKDKKIYAQAITDYISGMTDSYAIKIFNELLEY